MNDQLIQEAYKNLKLGGLSVPKTVEYFKGKFTSQQVKDAIQKTQVHQTTIKATPDRSLYVPINTDPTLQSYQTDLMFLDDLKSFNKNYSILFVFINVMSRNLYVYPLKNKNTTSIIKALKQFIEDINYNIDYLYSDSGSEFISKEFKDILDKREIKQKLIQNKSSLSIVERANKTIRNNINKYLIANNTNRYIDKLDDIIENINTTRHSTIKVKPDDSTLKDQMNRYEQNLEKIVDIKRFVYDKFPIGSKVRLIAKKKLFEKGSDHYTNLIYTVIGYTGNQITISDNNNKTQNVPYSQVELFNNIDDNTNKIIKKDEQISSVKTNKKIKKKLKSENIDKINIISKKTRKSKTRKVATKGKQKI